MNGLLGYVSLIVLRTCWRFSDVHAKLYHRPLLHLFRKRPVFSNADPVFSVSNPDFSAISKL
jgi:hypothetical protein